MHDTLQSRVAARTAAWPGYGSGGAEVSGTTLEAGAEEPAPCAGDLLPAGAPAVPAVKPLLRGWLHLISFEASLVLGTLALANQRPWRSADHAIAGFAASVSAMFGTSALYHRGNWAAEWHRRLQRLDHAMIFLLIASTATPVFLIAAHGVARLAGLIMMWTLTLTAGAIHMAWMNAPERLIGGTFVGLGCVARLALPQVWLHSGVAAGALMLAGGVFYIAGALSYRRRWLNAFPTVFGYHGVFHVYVYTAAACQHTAITLFIT
jgi:hemolysin III